MYHHPKISLNKQSNVLALCLRGSKDYKCNEIQQADDKSRNIDIIPRTINITPRSFKHYYRLPISREVSSLNFVITF